MFAGREFSNVRKSYNRYCSRSNVRLFACSLESDCSDVRCSLFSKFLIFFPSPCSNVWMFVEIPVRKIWNFDHRIQLVKLYWLSVEIKPKICKLVKNLFRSIFLTLEFCARCYGHVEAGNQKFFFAIEFTDHVLACHGRGFLIFATWWRYRANENLHWNFVERHPVADTTHVIHHSNRLDELIPNMYDTWLIWPLLVKKFDQAVKNDP